MQPEGTFNNDDIARLAYKLWERGGSPEGRSLEFWLQAEQRLMSGSRDRPAKIRFDQLHSLAGFGVDD